MLEINTIAPHFSVINQNNEPISERVFSQNPFSLIYFYAEDDTPVCNKHHFAIREGYEFFRTKNIAVYGISPDSPESHHQFKQKENLPFELWSDPSKTMMKNYFAWGEKNMYGKIVTGILRRAYLIDATGKIIGSISKANTKDFIAQCQKNFIFA